MTAPTNVSPATPPPPRAAPASTTVPPAPTPRRRGTRSIFILALFGTLLLTIAVVVRSGMLARKNPGRPINAAMRASLGAGAYDWPERDAQLIALYYPGARDTTSGLRYLFRQAGTGTARPVRDQVVTIAYTSRLLDGEQPIDDSAKHGGPFNFVLGQMRVYPGLEEAVLQMLKGEKRTLFIPYWLALGERGIRGKIPGRATIVVDVELIDFKNP